LLKHLYNRISGILSISNYHLAGLNCRYSQSCPALFSLRNELKRHIPGCRVRISQLTINDPYYRTLQRLAAESGALFFSVYIWNHQYISRLLGDLARLHPLRPLIIGGPQAANLENLPVRCTRIDGEVEAIPADFYRDLRTGNLRPLYRAGPAGSFAAPYRPEDFAGHLRDRYIYYESSRGCPFGCSYCLSASSRGVRYKETTLVRAELEMILSHSPRLVKFVDRTFNDRPERALEIWRFLVGSAGKTRFHFEIAPDGFNEEMLAFLETVPLDLFQFEIGIQSTNAETLRAINRRMDVERALATIAALAAFDNIHLHVDLILGLPMENGDSFLNSFNRVFNQRPHQIQMGLLKVLPGTPMSRRAREFGLLYCGQPPYEILATAHLSPQEIARLHLFGVCVEAFYNTRFFNSFWEYLRRHNEDAGRFFMALTDECRYHDFFNRAPTQQLMAEILTALIATRPDSGLVREILRFDWLRSGNRHLPHFLISGSPAPDGNLRRALRRRLPLNLPGYYTYQTREEFFKRHRFAEFSAAALAELGLDDCGGSRYLCFSRETGSTVMKHGRVHLLPPEPDDGSEAGSAAGLQIP